MSFTLVPAMAKLFSSFKTELPMGTKILIALSDLFIHKPYMAILPFVGLYFFFSNWGKIAALRPMQDLFLKIPVVGVLVRKSAAEPDPSVASAAPSAWRSAAACCAAVTTCRQAASMRALAARAARALLPMVQAAARALALGLQLS